MNACCKQCYGPFTYMLRCAALVNAPCVLLAQRNNAHRMCERPFKVGHALFET